jgi:hypothetical protein
MMLILAVIVVLMVAIDNGLVSAANCLAFNCKPCLQETGCEYCSSAFGGLCVKAGSQCVSGTTRLKSVEACDATTAPKPPSFDGVTGFDPLAGSTTIILPIVVVALCLCSCMCVTRGSTF